MAEHAMHYRAGMAGFGRSDRAPHWHCECGRWTFAARPNSRAATGNNLAAAQRSWAAHVAVPDPEEDNRG